MGDKFRFAIDRGGTFTGSTIFLSSMKEHFFPFVGNLTFQFAEYGIRFHKFRRSSSRSVRPLIIC
jgi:hypothetical protein